MHSMMSLLLGLTWQIGAAPDKLYIMLSELCLLPHGPNRLNIVRQFKCVKLPPILRKRGF